MKRLFALLVLVSGLAAACGNSIDPVANPTPTPGESPTPSGDLDGHYSVAANPAQTHTCTLPPPGLNMSFGAPLGVDIAIDGGDFTPDWHLASYGLTYTDTEHGSISGNDFTANYTYCEYDLGTNNTLKHVATFEGTFNGDGTFDGSVSQVLRSATGNQLGNCGAGEMDGAVTTDMGTCTNPGVSWNVHGVHD
jgi:hypothetical protein